MNEILTITEHQTIKVAKNRDVLNNTISNEDRNLLLGILFTKSKNNKKVKIFEISNRNQIKANSIVGSITLKNNLIVEILPKFAKGKLDKNNIKKFRETLINMIRVSRERNFISSSSIVSKINVDEMPLINYVIELFSESLLNEFRQGLYLNYAKKTANTSVIKGKILLSKTLQNNFIDKSKVYIEYRKHNTNNLLMQIFKSLVHLLLKDNSLSYNAKNNLMECYSILEDVEIINLKLTDFDRVVFNRLNDNFENLFIQARFVFSKYIPFTTSINSTPFWSILFDMDYLFEKFLAYLLKKSNINVKEQFIFTAFTNNNKTVRGKPDFILKDDEDNMVVADAKWKILTKKGLYGLNAQNFWQLTSYMNLIKKDEINGYFIVPKIDNSLDDEIEFKAFINGKKNIKILSINFILNFKDIIKNYKFEFKDNILSFNKIFNKFEDINNLENDFLKLSKMHTQNKKNYIKGITEKDFINEYLVLNKLLFRISDESFKNKKNTFLYDFVKLSNTKIRRMFQTMRRDDSDGIDVNLIMNYIKNTPNTKLNKRHIKKEHSMKSWKNK
jgi:5-methylcytosine-specific restriction enzyme subunit McrC